MKTFEQFIQLDERAFSPAGQAARTKMRQQNELNKQKKRGGALVKTEKPGSLATRPADKGAAIVRTKKANQTDSTGFKADPKKQTGFMSSPDTKTKLRSRPVNKKAQARRVVRKGLKGAAGLAGKAIGALRSQPPTEIEKASPLSLTPGGVNSKYSK